MSGMDFTPLGILTVAFQVLMILFSLSVHESAHAWTADRLGDPTARMLGRITLNPIPHIDPVGTVLLPAVLALMGAPVFGWAKPVPVISRNFRHLRRDEALVSVAGPASNLLIAVACTAVLSILMVFHVSGMGVFEGSLELPKYSGPWWIYQLAFLNLVLAMFNLIPIPPLDGSWVLSSLLPRGVAHFYEQIRRFGPFILLLFFFTPVLRWVLTPLVVIGELLLIRLPLTLVAAFA